MHGGNVSVRSPGLGQGATFTIRIPVVPSPLAPVSKDTRPQELSLRVLIVDDNRDGADSLALLLSASGHAARTAYSAEEALLAVRDSPPDVVVLDIGLPHMDGYEVARQIKAQGCRSRLVALSGYGQPEDVARSREVGFAAHLVKPVDADMLMTAIMV